MKQNDIVSGPAKGRTIIMTVTAFIVTLLLCAFLVNMSEQKKLAGLRKVVAEVGASQAYSISRQLDRSISATYALASLIQEYGEISNFEELAQDMIARYGGISSLQLAPSGVVRKIYPLEGNEAAIGHDILNDPERRTEALEAVQSEKLTLAGPFELIQGGMAVIGRYPVFLEEKHSDTKRFWGFTIVLIKLDKLLAASNQDQLVSGGYQYNLSRQDPDTAASLIIAGNDHNALIDPVAIDIPVPNGHWSLELAPQEGWYSFSTVLLESVASVLMSLIITVLFYQRMSYMGQLLNKNNLLKDEVRQRRLMEEALQKSEKKFREIIEYSSDIICIVGVDGMIMFESPSVEKILGYTPGERKGRNAFEFMHEDDQEHAVAALGKAVALPDSIERVVYRVKHKNGSWRTLDSIGRNLLHDEGINGVVVHSRDITEQKKMEENLRISEEKFSKAFYASPDSVTITSLEEGRFIEVNEGFEKVFGYSPDEVLGKTPFELNLYRDPNHRQYIREILKEKGSVQGFYLEIVRKCGEVRDCMVYVENIVINGKPHIVTIVRDITDLKIAEEKKDELIKELEEALSEIKTLSGLIPICSCCKKIRDDNGYWNQIEIYIRDRSDADFSHGICPDCAKEVYPNHYKKMLEACSDEQSPDEDGMAC